jgi:translation initiation factor 3 subunit A
MANEAFKFCLKYDRKTEFRRLCEALRSHLNSVGKYASQPFAIDFNDPETLQRHLDIRFSQLNAAAELELWQEGFRSVEDILNLIEVSQKTPKQYMMANYYEKLSRILMKGENYLFHAASFEKYVAIQKENPNLNEDAHKKYDFFLIVATLPSFWLPFLLFRLFLPPNMMTKRTKMLG